MRLHVFSATDLYAATVKTLHHLEHMFTVNNCKFVQSLMGFFSITILLILAKLYFHDDWATRIGDEGLSFCGASSH